MNNIPLRVISTVYGYVRHFEKSINNIIFIPESVVELILLMYAYQNKMQRLRALLTIPMNDDFIIEPHMETQKIKKHIKKPDYIYKMKPGMKRPIMRPSMKRLRTIWITEPKKSFLDFQNKYNVLEHFADGLFTTFRCEQRTDGQIFSVRQIPKETLYRLHPSDNIRQSLLTSMQAELAIMAKLMHRHVVRIPETYETKHTLYLVMEECKGGRLVDHIMEGQTYTENEVKRIVKMILNALNYMHMKHRIVHTDLSPENILFVDNSETSDIKIIGFGMSKVLPRLNSLRSLEFAPYYTAPEIINGDYSHAADCWSVGVIAYAMIFGYVPFGVDMHKYYGVQQLKQIYKLILKGFDPQIKKGYGAWFPRDMSNRLSKNGMDFIAHLLEKDVAKRLTAHEASNHPWLKGNDDTKIITETYDKENETSRLNSFHFSTSYIFKFVIGQIFRDQYANMKPTHFQQLEKLFIDSDENGTGKISYAIFEDVLLKLRDLNWNRGKLSSMFQELDKHNDIQIEYKSLLNAMVHDYLVATDQRLYKSFRDLDENETGKIKSVILKKKMRDLNPYGVSNTDVILQMIDDVDLDGDGWIDYEEFLRACHPDFNETPNWFWT